MSYHRACCCIGPCGCHPDDDAAAGWDVTISGLTLDTVTATSVGTLVSVSLDAPGTISLDYACYWFGQIGTARFSDGNDYPVFADLSKSVGPDLRILSAWIAIGGAENYEIFYYAEADCSASLDGETVANQAPSGPPHLATDGTATLARIDP